MRIAFYAPFKPLGHPHPSGDLVIAGGLYDHLRKRGHDVRVVSTLRSRWIFWKPWNILRAVLEKKRITRQLSGEAVDLWLTYHTYYKAPDLIGPDVCSSLRLPYVIFQGSYASRVSRSTLTRPGFVLNRKALLAADLVLTNRRDDLVNLQRLLPPERLGYLPPGIDPSRFIRDNDARRRMRRQWRAGGQPVIVTAAMFRADVKTRGLIKVIESCGRLLQQGHAFLLVIAGNGRERRRLASLAAKLLGDRVIFTGRIDRDRMFELYSGGDLFVFPGINESLGMVYLEAQSCGLPVVAYDNGGIPEVVDAGRTGLLTEPFDDRGFDQAVIRLLTGREEREQMGVRAAAHIRRRHDLERNYALLEQLLLEAVRRRKDRSESR
ncbi:MAG: glycosyltransferase family 4 protein [Desulfobulbaceae bacterium]|jgi:glycosyltransferase involved in cell wall biosynthesis|nr:glycosyltransferase family 4 protein [Desulfobulbaceae bacterium]